MEQTVKDRGINSNRGRGRGGYKCDPPDRARALGNPRRHRNLWAGGGGPALVGGGVGGSASVRAREERERKRVEAVCLSNGTPSGDPQMKQPGGKRAEDGAGPARTNEG